MLRVCALGLLLCLGGCFAYPDITLQAEPRPAIQTSQVKLITELPPAGSYQRMARVYAWSSIPVDSPAGFDSAVAKLQERAASIGANALLLPKREQISWPVIRSIWMSPEATGRFGDGEETRPTELMGQALYIAP